MKITNRRDVLLNDLTFSNSEIDALLPRGLRRSVDTVEGSD